MIEKYSMAPPKYIKIVMEQWKIKLYPHESFESIYGYGHKSIFGPDKHKNQSNTRAPIVAQQKQIWLVPMRMRVRSLASLSGSGIQHCCELWCRSQTQLRSHSCCGCGVDPAAVVPTEPLAWELPYAMGVVLQSKKKKSVQSEIVYFLWVCRQFKWNFSIHIFPLLLFTCFLFLPKSCMCNNK